MKTAICTHCAKDIHYDKAREAWLHTDTNGLCCQRIEFATPKRGSVRKAETPKGESKK